MSIEFQPIRSSIDVATIAGSPTHPSRSAAVLAHLRAILNQQGYTTEAIRVQDLNATELFGANFNGASIKEATAKVQQARAVIIATPVYKAAYTGVLKAFLDLLPQDGLADRVVLPIATGGSVAHLLSIDYALKPVLSALGAQHVLSGIFIQDSQLEYSQDRLLSVDPQIEARLQASLQKLARVIGQSNSTQPSTREHIWQWCDQNTGGINMAEIITLAGSPTPPFALDSDSGSSSQKTGRRRLYHAKYRSAGFQS